MFKKQYIQTVIPTYVTQAHPHSNKNKAPHGVPQCVEKLATGNFFDDYVAEIFHLWGALYWGIPTSAEVGLGRRPKYPPPFEKGGRKL